jgi:predicted metalloprotease with PDZ domain
VAGYAPASLVDLSAFAKTALAEAGEGKEIPFAFQRADSKVKLTVLAPVDQPRREPAPTAAAAPDQTVFCMLVNDSSGYVLVKDVAKETPAFVAGIRGGDIITAVAGRPVATNQELAAMIERQPRGEQVAFRVLRGAKSLEAAVSMMPCEPPPAAQVDLAAISAQLKVMQAQIEELRQTAETLQASLELMSRGQQEQPVER